MTFALKPTHRAVKAYYEQLATLGSMGIRGEGAVAPAFANLLRAAAGNYHWTVAEQFSLHTTRGIIRTDGALLDEFKLLHGIWEAKDTDDDLAVEVRRKFDSGYPRDNILFQAPDQVILVQNGREVLNSAIREPKTLLQALAMFFEYQPPAIDQWQRAVEVFKESVPQLGSQLKELIERAKVENPRFKTAFATFYQTCREVINPNLSVDAVEEMLIQHILTERLFRKVFANPDFVQRNVIAREIETVFQALTSQSFSREEFMRPLDHFYGAIEQTAESLSDFSQKQQFLNAVYEKFFQGFSVKAADVYGIVYTPLPVVDFMVRSVQSILKREFGRGLEDEGVHILDPFVGTGTFIVQAMRHMPRGSLAHKFARELHCNEIMLMPYYIASQNIEHTYYELTGQYAPFEGICLVDTFEDVRGEGGQYSITFGAENTERVRQQRRAPIYVIMANPPYNAGQVNVNDNNKNRTYPGGIDKRVSETYAKASSATLKNKLSDPYVKAFRWASDRIGSEGVIAFITNNGFLDGIAFDGMRAYLEQEFTSIYHLDLKGNARTSGERRQREGGNIFDDMIRVGVGITFLVRKADAPKPAHVFYHAVPDFMRAGEKRLVVETARSIDGFKWTELTPDARHTWLTQGMTDDFKTFIPMGSVIVKSGGDEPTIFRLFGLGINTSRDAWVYNFDKESLSSCVERIAQTFNDHVSRYDRLKNKPPIDSFVSYDDSRISWSEGLKTRIRHGKFVNFDADRIRIAVYRPFTSTFVYFDPILIERVSQFSKIFPQHATEQDNRVICLTRIGVKKPFHCLMVSHLADLHLTGDTQCYPFYTYKEDGSERKENIPDETLGLFRAQYRDVAISKWDIFHYVYGLLHSPEYRTRYAANLRRDLPHLPFAPDFWAFARAGARLADLHVGYEDAKEYPLESVESAGVPVSYRVEKMRLMPDLSIRYNDFLTLRGVPAKALEYKLGSRSALGWIIEEYRVTVDPRSGIRNDPNRADDPKYILRLLGKIITVSLETVAVVEGLPGLG